MEVLMTNRVNLDLKAAIIRKYGSQARFACRIKMDKGSLSEVVRGRKDLNEKQKARWAKLLKVEPTIFK